jgi:hypothetical protein
LVDLVPYSPFFQDDEGVPMTDLEQVVVVLVRFDEGIVSNNVSLFKLLQDYRLEHSKAGVAITALWLRLEALSAIFGTCPTRLSLEYLAPSV